MRSTRLDTRLAAVLLLANCLLPAAHAQDPAGSAIFATGPVNAQRTQLVPIAKGDSVFVSDVIVTGPAGRAQIELLDGAKIAIRPESQLAIEEFVFAGTETQPQAPVAVSSDRSALNLLKGGFRTITGIIGEADEEAYEVRTPVGTLGIRGTDYAVLYCLSDCLFAGLPPEDGLYITVTGGIVVFRNELIEIEIEAGQFVFIPIINRLPQLLDAPLPVMLDEFDVALADPSGRAQSPDPRTQGFAAAGFSGRRAAPTASAALAQGQSTGGGGTGGGGGGTGSTNPGAGPATGVPAQSITAVDIDGVPFDLTAGTNPVPLNRSMTYVTGPLGAPPSPPFGATRENTPAEYGLDAGNNLVSFVGPYPSPTGPPTLAQFDVGTAANVDTGFDSLTMLRWGRWTGGTVAITLPGGVDASQDMRSQSLHWITGPQGSPPVMPTTGTASYTLVGATSPTDNLGNVGVLGNATFAADFTNMSVTNTVDLTIAGSQWTATGTAPIGGTNPPMPAHVFGGPYAIVTIDGTASGSGSFTGFFSEPGSSDPNLPGGAGVSYSLSDMTQSVQVSGALAFGNPN